MKRMAMAWVWTGMVAVSVVYGWFNGTIAAVGDAALEGAGAAVGLCPTLAGILCPLGGIFGGVGGPGPPPRPCPVPSS